MADNVISVEVDLEEERNRVTDSMQTVTRAGLGVVGYGQDAVKDAGGWLDKLVERGESVEKDSRKMFDDFVKARRKQVDKRTGRVEKELEERIETVLHRLNVPTRKDVASLQRKIDRLNKKIDALKDTKNK